MSEKLKLLLDASTDLFSEKDLKSNLIKLSDIIKELLNVDICSIFLHDRAQKELWTIVVQKTDLIRMPDNRGIVGSCFQTGELIAINDAYKDDRFDKEVDKNIGYHTRNILAVPMINNEGATFGVLEAINKLDGSDFKKDDMELLNHLTLYASSIIENAILHDKIRNTNEDIIYKLSHLTKFKEPETKNHILRVGNMVEILARSMDFPEDEINILKQAAFMHDIGKIGIPDEIIQKSERLTREDWEMIKQHTIWGHDILRNSTSIFLQTAAVISLDHHEYFDGSGYPNGKAGNEISLYARMTAIADVYDSMTSNKPYRKGFSSEDAIKYIKEKSGSQFDPEIVTHFIDNIEAISQFKSQIPD
jgi:HD-GYP domain-containing protein (c-di-GMP phosphodiesterase class II)